MNITEQLEQRREALREELREIDKALMSQKYLDGHEDNLKTLHDLLDDHFVIIEMTATNNCGPGLHHKVGDWEVGDTVRMLLKRIPSVKDEVLPGYSSIYNPIQCHVCHEKATFVGATTSYDDKVLARLHYRCPNLHTSTVEVKRKEEQHV